MSNDDRCLVCGKNHGAFPCPPDRGHLMLSNVPADMSRRRAPRVVGYAVEIEPSERYCTCCEKPLSGRTPWLELDQRTNTYHDYGGVPADKSQGWFVFGMTCAKNKLAEHRAKASLSSADASVKP